MSRLLYLGVGENAPQFYSSSAAVGGDPQLQFFENMPGRDGAAYNGFSNGTLSIHAVNIPLSLSFNNVVVLMSFSSAVGSLFTGTIQFGLYSLNAGTLSLANSASQSLGAINLAWLTIQTSATQDITPGNWYFVAFANTVTCVQNSIRSAGGGAYLGPFFLGQYSTTTSAIPTSIATSDLLKDGASGGIAQMPYILISA